MQAGPIPEGQARDHRAQLPALQSHTSTAQADVTWTPIGMSISFRKIYFENRFSMVFHGMKPDACDAQHGLDQWSVRERPRMLRSRWPRWPSAGGSLGATSRLGPTPALASGLLGRQLQRVRGGSLF